VIGAGSPRKFGKEAREVGMRLDAVRLGRLDQRVQAGARGGAGSRLTEEPVFSSQNGRIAFSTRLVSSGICG